jgi:predicted HTH transcriptional regulator
MIKELEAKAVEILEASLKPLPHEKNELDWKSDLSEKSDKLAQHISAFANHPGGGFFVFGVNNDGVPVGVRNHDYSEIIKKLGNIAREGVVSSVAIDHSIIEYQGKELLFIYIPDSSDKPVYTRGGTVYDSYVRSAGQTRKMTRQEVARLIATSSGGSFETESASITLTNDEVIKRLDIQSFFDLLGRPFPQDSTAIVYKTSSKIANAKAEQEKLLRIFFSCHPLVGGAFFW